MLDKTAHDLYINALNHSDKVEMASILCDSLEKLAQKTQDPYILYASSYAKVANIIRTPNSKRSEKEIENEFRKAHERGRKVDYPMQEWLLNSFEVSAYIGIQRYSTAEKIYDKMINEAKALNDFYGLCYGERAKVEILHARGNAAGIRNSIKVMLDIIKKYKKNTLSTDIFIAYGNVEPDLNKVKEMYKLGLENTGNELNQIVLMRELAYIAAKEKDKEEFNKWHDKIQENLLIAKNKGIRIDGLVIRTDFLKYAFDGDKETAYAIVDSIQLEKEKCKRMAALILDDYKTALECSLLLHNEKFRKYNNAEDFDNGLLYEYVENGILRENLSNQRMYLIELETQKNLLLKEKRSMLVCYERDRQEIANKRLANIEEEERQREKKDNLQKRAVIQLEREAETKKAIIERHRQMLVLIAISLGILMFLALAFFFNQRNHAKELERLKRKVEESNIG